MKSRKYFSFLLIFTLFFCLTPTINANDFYQYKPLPYDSVEAFHEGLAIITVEKDGVHYFGYMDTTGKVIIEPQFDDALHFSEGVAAVLKEDYWGFIDKTGNIVIDFQFDDGNFYEHNLYFHEGLAIIYDGENYIYIDKTGKRAIEKNFDFITHFHEGLAAVEKDGKFGYIDKSGKVVIDFLYDYADYFSEGLAPVEKHGKYGFINKAGNVAIDFSYDLAYSFEDGAAQVIVDLKNNEDYSYIDKSGKILFQPNYDSSGPDRLLSKLDESSGMYGFIDIYGNWAIKPQYDLIIDEFQDGVAFVSTPEYLAFIDTSGNILDKFSHGVYTTFFDNGYAVMLEITFDPTGSYLEPTKYFIYKAPTKPSDWAADEVNEAKSLNLIPESMQNHFTSNITRADFSRLAVHFVTVKTGKSIEQLLNEQNKTITRNVFMDTNDMDILVANALGIVKGKGNGRFDPNGHITREEAATMLMRLANLLNYEVNATGSVFADANHISNWAKDGVNFVSTTKDKTNELFVMGGTSSNYFSPKNSYTREQAFITMKRLYHAE